MRQLPVESSTILIVQPERMPGFVFFGASGLSCLPESFAANPPYCRRRCGSWHPPQGIADHRLPRLTSSRSPRRESLPAARILPLPWLYDRRSMPSGPPSGNLMPALRLAQWPRFGYTPEHLAQHAGRVAAFSRARQLILLIAGDNRMKTIAVDLDDTLNNFTETLQQIAVCPRRNARPFRGSFPGLSGESAQRLDREQ